MASTRLFSVLLLATLACQSLSQVTGPLYNLSNVEGELGDRSPVFNPMEVEAKVTESNPNDEKVLEKFTEDVQEAFEKPTEVIEKAFKDPIEVVKALEMPTEIFKKPVEEPTIVVDKALQEPTEVAKEAFGAVTSDEGEFEPQIQELPAWTTPKFIEAANKITKTIKEELTKIATSLMREESKRPKRDLVDQMGASSNDIDYDFDENKMDVDFVLLEGKPEETNTVRPPANPMNAQRYYYHTSTPQTTPEYYRYMPTAPEYTVEVPQENMKQSTNQATLPLTFATTTETPSATQYNQTPQEYQVSATQAPTTPIAVSENQLPFYPQYRQGYPTSATTTASPAATKSQETLFEEMTDNVESQIVEEEGMPKITQTSRTSTYKVSQSYPHESTYKQSQQMHYYFMLK